MRILIVTDQYPPMVGGVPNVTHGLAVDFAQRGHSVWVVAPSYGPRDTHRSENHVHVYRFSSFAWPTYEELRIPFLPLLPVRNLLKKLDPDIIHLHSPAVLGNIAQLMAGGLRKPLIATNHYLPINMSRSLSADPVLSKPFNNVTYTFLINFCNPCQPLERGETQRRVTQCGGTNDGSRTCGPCRIGTNGGRVARPGRSPSD